MSKLNTALLLNHAIKQRLTKKNHNKKAHSRQQTDLVPDAYEIKDVQMTETRIYVGLNDSETREQKYETEKYVKILKDVCKGFHVAFSMDIEEGGYYHEDGEYIEETSLVLVLIDANRDVVKEIAQNLCTIFHQESVLVTEGRISGYYVVEDEEA